MAIENNRHTGIAPTAEYVLPGHRVKAEAEYKVKAMTKQEQIYHMAFNVHNKRQSNGRINLGMDENGNLIANSVSPMASGFWRNVEPKVQCLVKALQEKRYLTYSSCQGHTLENRRYVGVAFGCRDMRARFAQAIKELAIPGVKVNLLDTIANNQASIEEFGSRKVVVKNLEKADGHFTVSPEAEAESFNVMFRRNYAEYCFAELIIYDVKPSFAWFRHPVMSLIYLYRKLFRWDSVTGRVARAISEPEFPIYRL